MEAEAVQNIYNEIIKRYNFSDLEFEVKRMRSNRMVGCYNYLHKKITLNAKKLSELDEDTVTIVILHELAHHIVKNKYKHICKAHGKEFRFEYKSILRAHGYYLLGSAVSYLNNVAKIPSLELSAV